MPFKCMNHFNPMFNETFVAAHTEELGNRRTFKPALTNSARLQQCAVGDLNHIAEVEAEWVLVEGHTHLQSHTVPLSVVLQDVKTLAVKRKALAEGRSAAGKGVRDEKERGREAVKDPPLTYSIHSIPHAYTHMQRTTQTHTHTHNTTQTRTHPSTYTRTHPHAHHSV